MNPFDELDRIMKLVRDMADEDVLRNKIGNALVKAYRDGLRHANAGPLTINGVDMVVEKDKPQ